MFTIRRLKQDQKGLDFLMDMLYESIYLPSVNRLMRNCFGQSICENTIKLGTEREIWLLSLWINITSLSRRYGIGYLMDRRKDMAYDDISLSVDLKNTGAVRLYQQLGFGGVKTAGTSKTMLYLF